MKTKPHLLSLTHAELKQALISKGFKPFLSDQIFNWLYKKYTTDITKMRNISAANQALLMAQFETDLFKQIQIIKSKDGQTAKYIFTLTDDLVIEAVLLQEKNYQTLCLSSQAGCPLKCKFCLTGKMGFKRNLSVQEIVGQVLTMFQNNQNPVNLVFMGMGEPLLNLENVIQAIAVLEDKHGLDYGKRRITVSTAGIIQSIDYLIQHNITLNLAFSVGHPDPIKRTILMSAETKNPIISISRLLHRYLTLHNRKLTLEYTLLDTINDNDIAITELSNLAHYLDAKINLINLNPHPDIPFKPVSKQKLSKICQTLLKSGNTVTIRQSKGQDIGAACGQLAPKAIAA
ncbi:23S rRNA (adenine(2503)-C(2))-methyltransferase RlmN [Thermoproteota archaeon]